jgi:eukaryotic-like serine/threonine-protein kinase
METAGNDDGRLTPPYSTVDDGVDGSSYNKTIAEGEGSTCQDDASDWQRWVSVESTVEGKSADRNWQWGAIDFALDSACAPLNGENGHDRDPDGTFVWDPQLTLPPVLESTVWPVGSSLLPSGNGRTEAIDGFEIISELGRGGMGVVYKARDLRLKRLVALKVIRYDRHQNEADFIRFQIEAEALARLVHPNILGIYEIGKTNGVPFVALELLEGGSLKDRLAGTPQPVRDAATLLSTLAHSLHAAHLANILHRDLKPSNILFDSKGVPKIADFGLAKRLDVEDGETIPGQVIGTPSYMAPEQAEGWAPEIGKAADIYALGAILYEMLTGRPPIKGATQTETLKLVREEDPVSPSRLRPKLPFDLETICLTCIAREPGKRYADALGLAEDLDRFLADKPIKARRTPLRERAIKLARRHPVLTLILALSVAACAVVSLAALNARNQRDKRILNLFETNEQRLFSAQTAKGERHWDDVLTITSAAVSDLAGQSDERLGRLGRTAASLKDEASRELAKQGAMAKSRDQMRVFRDNRDEAQFLDTRYEGLTRANSLEATRRFARAGLRVFGSDDAGRDEWTLTVPTSGLSEEEQIEVTTGFYELLLILADAVSHSPEAEPAERALKALRILDRALAVRSRPNRAYHQRRAEYPDMRGDGQGAARERQAAEQIAPVDALDFYLIGREFFRRQEWSNAIKSFEGATQRQPEHFWAKCLLAISHLQIHEPALARFGLTACVRQRPDRVWLYLLRGLAYAAEGKRARDNASAVPNPPPALLELAAERFKAAELDYDKALELLAAPNSDPDLKYALLVNRGSIWIERQDLTAATADFQAAIAQNSKRFDAYTGLAYVYQQQGKTDLALTQLTTAIELKPQQAALHRARAGVLLGLGNASPDLHDVDLRELEEHIREMSAERLAAAEIDLEDAIRYESAEKRWIALDKTKQAVLFHVAGRHDEALKACDASIEIVPKLAFAHQLRINVLLNLGRFDDLIESCDLALVSIKPSAELYYLRGMAKDGLEKHSVAVADYILALELEPKNARFLRRLAWSYLADNALVFALENFNKAIEIEPADADAFGGRGLARALSGRHEEAVSDASKSLELDKKDWRIAFNAGRVYAQAAVAVVKQPRDNGPVAVRVAARYLDRARELVAKALQHAPAEQRPILMRDPMLEPIRTRHGSVESLKSLARPPRQR